MSIYVPLYIYIYACIDVFGITEGLYNWSLGECREAISLGKDHCCILSECAHICFLSGCS